MTLLIINNFWLNYDIKFLKVNPTHFQFLGTILVETQVLHFCYYFRMEISKIDNCVRRQKQGEKKAPKILDGSVMLRQSKTTFKPGCNKRTSERTAVSNI